MHNKLQHRTTRHHAQAELEKNRAALDVALASFAKARAPKNSVAIDFGDDGAPAVTADGDDDGDGDGGTGFDVEYGHEAEDEKKTLTADAAAPSDAGVVNEADVAPTLARYNDLLWMCAHARELRYGLSRARVARVARVAREPTRCPPLPLACTCICPSMVVWLVGCTFRGLI